MSSLEINYYHHCIKCYQKQTIYKQLMNSLIKTYYWKIKFSLKHVHLKFILIITYKTDKRSWLQIFA